MNDLGAIHEFSAVTLEHRRSAAGLWVRLAMSGAEKSRKRPEAPKPRAIGLLALDCSECSCLGIRQLLNVHVFQWQAWNASDIQFKRYED
ncbi:hypothetical protein [Ruegeria intermedia]|uniref:hypothetical protein n=1 Tax=Ruegeria intermedia TaxID=996115 RepID=UPI00122CC92B|nr:hypothetical protein [Ruegeria intermedia]